MSRNSRMAVCRICLATDVNMHNISKSKVLEVFEKLTSKKLLETNRPSTMCYLCYSQLTKCSRILNLFMKNENVFEQLSCSGIEITGHTISFLKKSNVVELLITPLNHIDVKPTDQGNKKTEKSEIKKNLQELIIKEEPKDEPIEVKLEAIESEMECDIALQDILEDTYEESDDSAKDSTWDAGKEECFKNKSREIGGQHMENITTKDKHLQIQIDPKKPHSCKICKKSFAKMSRLQKHIKKHNPKNLVCSICCETFSFKCNLIRHEEIFHTKKKRYSCDECNKSYTRSDHLRNHKRSHSLNVKKLYPCSICNNMFATPSNVRQHINSIHLDKKPFACDQCDKTFNRKGNLQEHYRTHTGVKPFSCNKCDMLFSHLSNLKSHKFKMHSDS